MGQSKWRFGLTNIAKDGAARITVNLKNRHANGARRTSRGVSPKNLFSSDEFKRMIGHGQPPNTGSSGLGSLQSTPRA